MFLNSQCFFGELTDDLLSICQPFSCGNEDLDDFFRNDAKIIDGKSKNNAIFLT